MSPPVPMMTRIARRARRELRRWRPHFLPALEARFGPDGAAEAFSAIEAALPPLLARMPDPGWRAPHARLFSLGGAIYIAAHLALRDRGLDAAASWDICAAATRARFDTLRGAERWFASKGMFSFVSRWLNRSFDRRSRAAPLGNWVARYVPGTPGEHDFGVDYTRCAIRELALEAGAADFAPYICLADVIGSDLLGWGLKRTETLAQGGARCDFRFRQGQPTEVKVRLPVVG